MVSRRDVLALFPTLATAAAPAVARAVAPAVAFKLAHSTPLDHPLHIRLTEAADHIARDTSGGVAIEVFPLEQLGSQLDVLGQVRVGAVDFIAISGLILSALIPAAAISGIPFAFPTASAVWTALDGPLGASIRTEIEKSGSLIAMPTLFDNGFRQITASSRQINGPADLVGLRIRIPPSALWVSLFAAFDAVPTIVTASEIYSALQSHLVDAEENPLALIWGYKLHEVQRHCALTHHLWDGLWLVGHRRRLEQLPAAWRSSVEGRLNAAALAQRADLAGLNTSLRQKLTERGMRFTEPDPLPFQARLRSQRFYARWREKFAPAAWAQLEAVAGPLR